MNTRKKLILIVLGGTVSISIIISVIALITRPQNSDSYLETAVPIVRDQDTGEIITNDPNTIEPGEQRAIIVIGLDTLYAYGLFESQVTTVRDKLTLFAEQQLNDRYETITIRPQDIQVDGGVLRTTLRLGSTETLLPLVVTFNESGLVRVVVEDPSRSVGGSYDSGETNLVAD